MRHYSEAFKADIRKRMSPPAWQSVTRISEETGIHICTLYPWCKGLRLGGDVRADLKSQHGLGWGLRLAIASSVVMSCITACIPARIERKPASRSSLRAAVRSVAIAPAPLPRSGAHPRAAGCRGSSASPQCSSGPARVAAGHLAWCAGWCRTEKCAW